MGGVTLQTHVLAPVDVGVGRRQRDLGGIWSKDESWQLEALEMLRWDGGLPRTDRCPVLLAFPR